MQSVTLRISLADHNTMGEPGLSENRRNKACVVSKKNQNIFNLFQVVSLQRIGVLTIWSIVQQKSKTVPPDIGKAFWSKMKLEKNQSISLLDHIANPLKDSQNGDSKLNFNLNAAKRRIINRKQEKNMMRKAVSRPKSAISFDFDSDRPSSAASAKIKRVLSVEKDISKNWESGIVCGDLKVMNWKDSDHYLIAKNSGEVLCCKRILGAVKLSKFCVASKYFLLNWFI